MNCPKADWITVFSTIITFELWKNKVKDLLILLPLMGLGVTQN